MAKVLKILKRNGEKRKKVVPRHAPDYTGQVIMKMFQNKKTKTCRTML